MLYLASNAADLFVLAAVIIIIGFAIFLIVRNKKKGRCNCGCNCGNCTISCDKEKPNKKT